MKWFLFVAALAGLSSVIIGAAGSHALSLDAIAMKRFSAALEYHQLYSLVLLAISLYGLKVTEGRKILMAACFAFGGGMILFCGSLYLAALGGFSNATQVAPAGGILLMGGWGLTAIHAFRLKHP